MKKYYRLLSDCHNGEWVLCGSGELKMVIRNELTGQLDLTNGRSDTINYDGDTRVFPLNLTNKVWADFMYDFKQNVAQYNFTNISATQTWDDYFAEQFERLVQNSKNDDLCNDILNEIETKINEAIANFKKKLNLEYNN